MAYKLVNFNGPARLPTRRGISEELKPPESPSFSKRKKALTSSGCGESRGTTKLRRSADASENDLKRGGTLVNHKARFTKLRRGRTMIGP